MTAVVSFAAASCRYLLQEPLPIITPQQFVQRVCPIDLDSSVNKV